MTPEERVLVGHYASARAQAGLTALLALDTQFAEILRSTSQPLVGQMRLRWWADALVALDHDAVPAEPTLRALAAEVVGIMPGATLATIADGWEALFEQPLDRNAIDAHGDLRGGGLFAAAARVLGVADDRLVVAGQGWALADLSRHLSDPALAAYARDRARTLLDDALARRWPPAARALGAMAHLARLDLVHNACPAGHPVRAARLLWHRLTGR